MGSRHTPAHGRAPLTAAPPRCLITDLAALAAGDAVPLDSATRHHLGRVLRRRDGDPLLLVDGCGRSAEATWTHGGVARVTRRRPDVPPPAAPLWLAVAPPRLPRLEWLVEKATELGVDRLLLLDTERTQRELGAGRLRRLRGKADAALLQCGRAHRLELDGPLPLADVLARHAERAPDGETWLAEPAGDAGRAPPPSRRGPLLLLVGPEGGFTGPEREAARAAGARAVTVGATVLRVETAALALAAWATRWEAPR